jgi:hypothetical protein
VVGGERGDAHRGRGLGRVALRPDERHPQRGGTLLGHPAHCRSGDVVGGEAGAAQRGGGRGRPGDVVERALDPLGDEVRERAREVEEELRMRALASRRRPAPPRLPALREHDHVAHLSSLA